MNKAKKKKKTEGERAKRKRQGEGWKRKKRVGGKELFFVKKKIKIGKQLLSYYEITILGHTAA